MRNYRYAICKITFSEFKFYTSKILIFFNPKNLINNYDKIANQYDTLSRLVFFKSQVIAQTDQLSNISKNSSVLIVGGGTGWILEEITKLHSSGLKIIYVEISAKMLALSKARNYGNNEVEFVNLGIEDFETNLIFDVILTPFLFDNFSEHRVEIVFSKLNKLLRQNGKWLLVDFCLNTNKGQWWKCFILKSMYLFFKLLGIVEATHLIDVKPYFVAERYQILEERFYYASFIKASIFKKNNMTNI